VSFPLSRLNMQAQAEAIGENPEQLRALDMTGTNRGMLTGIPDIWGDDPGVLARYAELMAVTQGVSPEKASQHVVLQKLHPLWRMLRTEYVFQPNPEGGVILNKIDAEPLKRFEFIPEYAVVAERDAIFQALSEQSFDPKSMVILEEDPKIGKPATGTPVLGEWDIEEEDTDEVVLSVETSVPGLLLMTDPYSRGWKVRDLSGSPPQEEYRLLPANYALRAIPLEAGAHHLRIYYWPGTLTLGIIISVTAILGCGGGLVLFRRRSKRTSS
jgi:hypothetical protein